MTIIIKDDMKILIPDDGKALTNGDTVSDSVYMPVDGDASAWSEIDIPSEDDEATEQDFIEALESVGVQI